MEPPVTADKLAWPFPVSRQDGEQTPPAVQASLRAVQDEVAHLQTLHDRVAVFPARRHQDSPPSHRPPSSDNPDKKRRQRSRASSSRQAGGQPGHPSHRHALLPPTTVQDLRPATLHAVVRRMRQEAEGVQRQHLLTALLALLPDEEMVAMVERLLADDDVLAELDLPYLRRRGDKSRAAGRVEGEAAMLLQLLQVRFGPLPDAVTARISTADAETLLRWGTRMLSAPTLEAVFEV